ncbi:sialin-like [Chironomus tepperi]|uniref:sialin-like n=1 Tax=Chironomus tepperi TaxID=113505 RepID=UPI00391F8A31
MTTDIIACDEDENLIEDATPFWKRRRNHLALLVFIGFVIIYTLRFLLSVGIIAMLQDSDIKWGSLQTGMILGSFFYGYIVTQIIGGIAIAFLPDFLILGIGVAITSTLTLASPVIVQASFAGFFAIRVIIGLVEGFALPSMNNIWIHWAPPLERTRLIGVQHAGKYIGTVLSLCTCGIIAANFDWSIVFYIYGGLGCMWAIVWIVLVRGRPVNDWFITDEEKQYLELTVPKENPEKKLKVPLKAVLTSMPVWAIIVAHFTENWGLFTMLTQMPLFLHHDFGFDISQSGYVSAIPYLVFGLTLFVAGFLADFFQERKVLTTSQVRRYFSCVSFLSQGIFMLLVAYIADALLVVMFISFGAALGALSTCGYAMNHMDIAPQFSSFVRSISSTIGTIPGIVAPLVAGLLVTIPQAANEPPTTITSTDSEERTESNEDAVTEHINQWKDVFIITAHVYFLGCIFYWFYSSGEVQPWAKLPEDSNAALSSSYDIESNPAEVTENAERPTRRKKRNVDKERRTKRDSSNNPSVHKNSSKNRHKSAARPKDNKNNKSKKKPDKEASTIGSRLVRIYDGFANYLSRIFKF